MEVTIDLRGVSGPIQQSLERDLEGSLSRRLPAASRLVFAALAEGVRAARQSGEEVVVDLPLTALSEEALETRASELRHSRDSGIRDWKGRTHAEALADVEAEIAAAEGRLRALLAEAE